MHRNVGIPIFGIPGQLKRERRFGIWKLHGKLSPRLRPDISADGCANENSWIQGRIFKLGSHLIRLIAAEHRFDQLDRCIDISRKQINALWEAIHEIPDLIGQWRGDESLNELRMYFKEYDQRWRSPALEQLFDQALNEAR